MPTPNRKSKVWNHAPELPLAPMPYWYWPPRPWAVLRWLFENFLQVSDRALFLVYSFVIAFWLMPFGPAEAAFAWDWAALVLLRNMVAVFLVVGGLHPRECAADLSQAPKRPALVNTTTAAD